MLAVLARAEYSAPDGVDDRCWRWWAAVKAVGSRRCGVKTAAVGAVEAAAVVAAASAAAVVVAPASAVGAALASEAEAAAAVVPTP